MKSDGNNSLSKSLKAEILDLASEVCNGQAGDEQIARLREILNGNPAANSLYAQYMSMHAELYWLEDAVQGRYPKPELPMPSRDESSKIWTASAWLWPLSMAAILLIGIGMGMYLAQPVRQGQNMIAESEVASAAGDHLSDEVAQITGSLNCRWETQGDDKPLGFGSGLTAGEQLQLVEGVAEITFQNGARMILQAPAELDVDSLSETKLHHGRLTATCPPGAEGFRVNTEGLTLVDLGTEFGVMADELGNTEVHVFEGLVEGHYRETEDGPLRTVQWRTNQTGHFDNAKHEISRLDKPATSFVRTLSPNLGPVSGLTAGEEFDYPVGPLGGQNGGFGWGGPWQNMTVESGSPKSNAVEAGSLRFGILSGSGNHATLKGQFNRIRRVLSTSFGGVFDTAGFIEDQDGARLIGRDGKTLYISFCQRVNRLDQVFYGFELNRGDGNRNRVLCVGHAAAKGWNEGNVRSPDKSAGVTGWAVTSEFNGKHNSLLELGDLGEETSDVSLFVIKISFRPGNKDLIEVFKDPESLWDEKQCAPDVLGEGNFAFDRISLANFEGNKTYEVDHIRIGTSFSAVTRPLWRSEPAPTIESVID